MLCSHVKSHLHGSSVSIFLPGMESESVYYTVDGSEPTLQSNSYDMSTGIPLQGTGERLVKVKNFKTGLYDSPTVEASYSLLPQTVSTLAGSSYGLEGSQDGFGTFSKFSLPAKMAVSGDYTLAYIADTGNHKIRRFDMQQGFTTTLAGSAKGYIDGHGTHAHFDRPHGIVLTPDGSYLYIGDSGNKIIRKIDVSTGEVSTVQLRPYAQSLALFKRSSQLFLKESTSSFTSKRSSMTHNLEWLDGDKSLKCMSKAFTDSKGHSCPEYDIHPHWCGFEDSAFACCICGGGEDVAMQIENATSFIFGEIADVALSLDGRVLYITDVGKHMLASVTVAGYTSGQIRVLAGGGMNSSKQSAYGTRAGFFQPFGLGVSPKTRGDNCIDSSYLVCELVRLVTTKS
jgi:hypothetical protein